VVGGVLMWVGGWGCGVVFVGWLVGGCSVFGVWRFLSGGVLGWVLNMACVAGYRGGFFVGSLLLGLKDRD